MGPDRRGVVTKRVAFGELIFFADFPPTIQLTHRAESESSRPRSFIRNETQTHRLREELVAQTAPCQQYRGVIIRPHIRFGGDRRMSPVCHLRSPGPGQRRDAALRWTVTGPGGPAGDARNAAGERWSRMPANARKDIVREGEIGTYHCWSRCVQRAFLCGYDPVTERDFDYRRGWIEDLLAYLARVFAIDVGNYSVLSNHLHALLRTRPDLAARWSAEEVALRWKLAWPSSSTVSGCGNRPTRNSTCCWPSRPRSSRSAAGSVRCPGSWPAGKSRSPGCAMPRWTRAGISGTPASAVGNCSMTRPC